MQIGIGDIVMVYGCKATIRYKQVPSKTEITNSFPEKNRLIGVEFAKAPKGSAKGGKEATNCFESRTGYGLLVRRERLEPYTELGLAVITIQRIFRGYIGRLHFLKLITFKFWNALECIEEEEALANNRNVGNPVVSSIMKQIMAEEDESEDMIDTLLDESQHPEGPPSPKFASFDRHRSYYRRSLLSSEIDAEFIEKQSIELSYKGPEVIWPLTRQFALSLMEHFRDNPDVRFSLLFYFFQIKRGIPWDKREIDKISLKSNRGGNFMTLPQKYAYQILIQTEALLKATIPGAVFNVEIPSRTDCRLILVGDVHGQLNDVLWLFYKFGPPSSSTIYVFNGDIADRGKYAVEIFLILFSFKLVCPESVVINRGNHESSDMNEVYGFAREVRHKYSGAMYRKFHDLFCLFPLCIILQKRVMVVHGGLFRRDNVLLSHLNRINRCRPCPSNPVSYDDSLMFDVLWSDPRTEPGRGFSSRGADCISFGPDVTDAFLKSNNLEVCIRSHQVPSNLRGFEPLHEGRCVTLFSASNYCGTTGNYGGVVIFDADMCFEIQEYMAPALSVMKKLHRELQTAVQKVVSQSCIKELEGQVYMQLRLSSTARMMGDIHKKLITLICGRKQELWNFCFNLDKYGDGCITRAQLREACSAVLGGRLPWVYFLKLLSIPTEIKSINYNDFLRRFRVDFWHPTNKYENWREQCVS
ncbi:serine/threonine protein phosphatase, partial [Cardiosporidium cionae]